MLEELIDLLVHLDVHLNSLLQEYGVWTYLILFIIIFCETGLVVTPFLPGDSLLFAAGALTALEGSPLNVFGLFILLSVAAIAGDSVNYSVGARIGARAFSGKIRWLKQEYMEQTHRFYEKYGSWTIVVARFVPIVRTFAPFVAGVGQMKYSRFLFYNVAGGIGWVGSFLLLGYLFGSHPFIKNNFSIVVLVIIIISVLPGFVQYWRLRSRKA